MSNNQDCFKLLEASVQRATTRLQDSFITDACYRPEPFTNDRQRVEYIFALYEQITAPLIAAAKPKRKKKME